MKEGLSTPLQASICRPSWPNLRRLDRIRSVLRPEVLLQWELAPFQIYDLTGVVCHSGSSYFGHYVSIGRLSGFDSTETIIGEFYFRFTAVAALRPMVYSRENVLATSTEEKCAADDHRRPGAASVALEHVFGARRLAR